MIITKLCGGLGNQLFQYAYGKSYAKKQNTSLLLDISWYKGRIDRVYMLKDFNISAKPASKMQIFFTKIFNKKDYIAGDWQSEKYFKNIEEVIRTDFQFKNKISEKNKIILNKIKSTNSVSIHLRGGDYVIGNKSGFHGVCSKEYYKEAIQKISQGVYSPTFFIFTDDIPWAQQHIEFPKPYILVSDKKNSPWEELLLMSSCKHNIIANSTFSWWGAWLNRNKNKIIIAPQKWFNDEKINSKDIIPNNWIKI